MASSDRQNGFVGLIRRRLGTKQLHSEPRRRPLLFSGPRRLLFLSAFRKRDPVGGERSPGFLVYLRPGSGNSCGGDSGGPDLVPGTYQVVALTDEGTCSYDEDTRLDVGSARSFLTGPH